MKFEVMPFDIDAEAEAILAQVRRMRDEAMHAIDASLGLPSAFTNRSLAQRRRFERERLEKEVTQ